VLEQRWDLFVSYASEDRVAFVLSLVDALRKRGVTIWFDQNELALGYSLRESINRGLAQSRFAVLVLSRHSLDKNWPHQEWDAVLALEEAGQKRVLPVIYDVSRYEVAEAFPLIADRLSADFALGMDRVVDDILSVVKPSAKVARASELIDFSHQQSQWMYLSAFSENRDDLTKMSKSWLEQPEVLDSAQVVLVPPPFHCRFETAEMDRLERWVDSGGGLLVFGCYDERHHASNFSELAWRFNFEFGLDAVLPAGSSESDARGHVLGRDPRYAVVVRPSVAHRLMEGVRELALISAATLWTTTMDAPELVVESPPDAVVMRPLGSIRPDGSRPNIESWIVSRSGPVPLIAARQWGQGKVVVVSTWKLCTVDAADNRRFLDNAIAWLRNQ